MVCSYLKLFKRAVSNEVAFISSSSWMLFMLFRQYELVIKNWKILCNEKVRLFLQILSNCVERARKNQTFRGFKFSLFLSGLKKLKKARARYTLYFIRNFYMNLQPEICQNFKNMLRTYPRLREEQFIFYCFCFPKCRKSELHNVLHGILVHVNFFSFNTFLLYMINNIFRLYSYKRQL